MQETEFLQIVLLLNCGVQTMLPFILNNVSFQISWKSWLILSFFMCILRAMAFWKAEVSYTVNSQSAIRSALKLLRHFTGIKLALFFGSTWCQKKGKYYQWGWRVSMFLPQAGRAWEVGKAFPSPSVTFPELKKYRLTKKRVFSASHSYNSSYSTMFHISVDKSSEVQWLRPPSWEP